MRRSWIKPNIFGYEIKVNRNDFLKDEKWRLYLDYCTDFYFVCPRGLIDKSELPAEIGLVITSTNAKRLFTIKKAITRDVQIPEELYKYILMCRSEIRSEHDNKDEYWRHWLAARDEEKSIGHRVSKKIMELVEKRIDVVDIENKRLKRETENLKQIKDFMLSIGFDEKNLRENFDWDLKPRLKQFAQQIPNELPSQMRTTINSLENISKQLRDVLRFFDDR